MNERIAKLMDQAGELAYEEHKAKCLKNGLDPMMPFGNNLMAILEKFAELIVRECADLVDHAISDGGVDGRVVKEHFGVE